MPVPAVTVAQGDIDAFEADAVVVNLFKGVSSPGGATGAVDAALDGHIADVIGAGDFKGDLGEVLVLYTRGRLPAGRVLVAGLGERDDFDLEAVRRASASAATKARGMGLARLATIAHGAGIAGLDPEACAQATVEGTLLALYEFKAHKSKADDAGTGAKGSDSNGAVDGNGAVEDIVLVERDEDRIPALERGVETAEAVAAGAWAARDLMNHPANVATPTYLADWAAEMAQRHDMRVDIWDRQRIIDTGMAAFASVAAGSDEEPQFIVVEHAPAGTESDPPVVLAGKAVTFDTGGISIKPSLGMERMKYDMGGGAAVLGALEAVGRLGLPRRVIGLVGATENMPSGKATRPGDIVTALNGTTIEILNTDAEGRLVLADALSYAANMEPKPSAVVDLATLTGAIVVALGYHAAGLFSNDDDLARQLTEAGDRSGERVWRLPTWAAYDDDIKSDVADIKNVSGKRPSPAGAVFAAKFLERFTDYPWAHLDIAGVGWESGGSPYVPKGGTGFGVRLLVDWLRKG